jgi:predicted phage tail component-like protein
MYADEFSFNGILSSTFDIYCEQETHSILPVLRKYSQEIPGLDGEVDFGIGGYGTRIIALHLYYKGTFKDLRENRENIIAWLAGDGTPKRLILGKEPDRYYMAKIYSEVNLENSSDRRIGTIEFECNPPWQYLLDGTLLTPEQIVYTNCDTDVNQFIKEFDSNGSLKLVNKGSAVKPIIKLLGNIKSGITLTYGEQSFILNTDVICDGVIIDCQNETVKRLSNGDNLYSMVDDNNNDFFELASGNCELGLSMTGLGEYPQSVTMIVQFNAVVGG